jgi:hypothetical protein
LAKVVSPFGDFCKLVYLMEALEIVKPRIRLFAEIGCLTSPASPLIDTAL